MGLIAFDQSLTRTGWCFIPGARLVREEVATGSFASIDPHDFGVNAWKLIHDLRPHLILYERPLDVVMVYGRKQLVGAGVAPSGDQLKLHRIAGILDGIAIATERDVLSVAPATWRAHVLGDGKLGRDSAKNAARLYCQRLGLEQRNHDEAESCCIAMYGLTSPEYRYRIHRK